MPLEFVLMSLLLTLNKLIFDSSVFQLKSTFHSNKSYFDEDHSDFEESASDVSLRPYLCSQSSDTVSVTQQTNSEIQSDEEISLSSLPSYNEVVLKGGHYQKGRCSLLLI